MKLALDSGHLFVGKDGKPADSTVIHEEVKPNLPFVVSLDLQAPEVAGHYVAQFSVRTNDAAGTVVCSRVSCDVQVDNENDCSVLLNDLMDLNTKEDNYFDIRMNAAGMEKRAPRESMAPSSAETMLARGPVQQQQQPIQMQMNA